MKTLGFFHFSSTLWKRCGFFALPKSTEGHHKGLKFTKMCQYEPYCYWWAVSYKKYRLKPEFLLEQTTGCSKGFPLLRAQWTVLLFLCLSGTWGKEIIASSSSLVERTSESPKRGCSWNNIDSLCNNSSNRKNNSLPFQAVPNLNCKMLMTNR